MPLTGIETKQSLHPGCVTESLVTNVELTFLGHTFYLIRYFKRNHCYIYILGVICFSFQFCLVVAVYQQVWLNSYRHLQSQNLQTPNM